MDERNEPQAPDLPPGGSGEPSSLGADANPFEQGEADPTGAGTVDTPGMDGGRPDGGDGSADFSVNDPIEAARMSKETVTNDAVAGETIMDGAGDGNDGPTGGAPREGSPVYAENDLADEDIDLDEQ